MKRMGVKLTSGVISGLLLVGAVGVPAQSAFASENESTQEITVTPSEATETKEVVFTDKEIQAMEKYFSNFNEEEFYSYWKTAVLDTQSEFVDPSVASQLLTTQETTTGIQPRGKITYSAKAGAKIIKATMNKVGKKAWNKMISKVESMTGTELVIFHWESINKFLDFAANSGDTIEGALTSYLVKHGFNKTVAKYVSKAFVLVVF